MHELFDGRLEQLGVTEADAPNKTENARPLTDGDNYVWVHGSCLENAGRNAAVSCLTRYGANDPNHILAVVAEAFDVEIFSEHEPQYWGFDTQAEWDAWLESINSQARDEFYDDLVRYLSSELCGIGPGTIGETWAKIGKALVEQRPELAQAGAKEELLDAIHAIYDRDHAVKITLDEKDLGLVYMIAAHSEDLPQA